MTQVTVNSNTYSDSGESVRDMRNGGHRLYLVPMLSDMMVEMMAALGYKNSAMASAVAAASSAATALALSSAFAPHESSPQSMVVKVDAGSVYDGSGVSAQVQQSTVVIVKPVANPRIDRIVGDQLTGIVSVIAGVEAVAPVAPAIPAGKFPIARVALTTATAVITNAMITDERSQVFAGLLRSGGSMSGPLIVQPATASAHPATAGQVQTQALTAFTSTGAAPAFVLTPVPALAAYAGNPRFRVKFHAAGTGADTLSISALGAKSIKQYDATGAKIAAVIAANQLADVEYDGVDFVVLDPLPGVMATAAEAVALASPSRPITPLTLPAGVAAVLNAAGQAAPMYPCRGWVNFNGTGTVSIWGSGNVSSITDNGVGDYSVNLITSLPDGNFAVAGLAGTNGASFLDTNAIRPRYGANGNSVRIGVINGGATSLIDVPSISLAIFR